MINSHKKLSFFIFDIIKVNLIFKELRLSKQFITYMLVPYYLFTLINALLEGFCMFLLVSIFTVESLANANNLPKYILDPSLPAK